MLTNTLIPFIWIKKYFRDYRILLENIADYLIDETQWWVEDDSGVKFLDLSEIQFSKELHHFHSSTIKAEEDFTNDCWEKFTNTCIQNSHRQPGNFLKYTSLFQKFDSR